MALQPCFVELGWPADAFFYAQTDFERQWRALGKPLHRARWRKCRAGVGALPAQ